MGMLDPQAMFLAQLGSGILAGGAPSRTPTTFGSVVGGAMGPALENYQKMQMQQMTLDRQNALLAETKRLHDAQITNYLSEAGHRTAQDAATAANQGILSGSMGRLGTTQQVGVLSPDAAVTGGPSDTGISDPMNDPASLRAEALKLGSVPALHAQAQMLLNRAKQIEDANKPAVHMVEAKDESGNPVTKAVWLKPGESFSAQKPVQLGTVNTNTSIFNRNPYTGVLSGKIADMGVSPNTIYETQNRPMLLQGVTNGGTLGGVLASPRSIAGGGVLGRVDTGLKPTPVAGAEVRADYSQGQQIRNKYVGELKPLTDSLQAYGAYQSARATGDNAQAANVAATLLPNIARSGYARNVSLKQIDALLGRNYGGGNVPDRITNFFSTEFGSGQPGAATMQRLDKLSEALMSAAGQKFAITAQTLAGQLKQSDLSVKQWLGEPIVSGNMVLFPDGSLNPKTGAPYTFKTRQEAEKIKAMWLQEH